MLVHALVLGNGLFEDSESSEAVRLKLQESEHNITHLVLLASVHMNYYFVITNVPRLVVCLCSVICNRCKFKQSCEVGASFRPFFLFRINKNLNSLNGVVVGTDLCR